MKSKQIMNRKRTFIFIASVATLIIATQFIKADDDDEDDDGYHQRLSQQGNSHDQSQSLLYKTSNLAAATNTQYKTECASCHMAYPPGFLPTRSWTKLMNGLDRHFGENASLDEKTKTEITDFLVTNSADRSSNRRSDKINRIIPNSSAPIRITETPYFIRKHDEINPATWKRPKIKTAANCMACHKGAEQGNFSEHEISIPR